MLYNKIQVLCFYILCLLSCVFHRFEIYGIFNRQVLCSKHTKIAQIEFSKYNKRIKYNMYLMSLVIHLGRL